MTKRLLFLLGVLTGQVLMAPYIVRLIRTPRIEALVIPDSVYNYNRVRHLQLKNMHNRFYLGGNTLNIYIASEARVNEEHQKQFNDETVVEGFYNVRTNTIWCVYDPLILYHEIKHVTEGDYHR